MSQSLTCIYIHLIFHVKTDSVAIKDGDQEKINAYVAGILNNLGCTTVAVGGIRDHIHMLFGLCPTIGISDLVKKVKTASHKYIETLSPSYRSFAWQSGYGAFSVSPTTLDKVKNYVLHQREHHRTKDFNNEYLMLLHLSHIPYDEKYVFSD